MNKDLILKGIIIISIASVFFFLFFYTLNQELTKGRNCFDSCKNRGFDFMEYQESTAIKDMQCWCKKPNGEPIKVW